MEMSDDATQAFNRIEAATKNGTEAEGVFQGIVASAQATRQPLEQTAEQFQQVTIATNALGLSYKQQIGFNQELNQLLIVSGASGQKAKAGIGDLLRGLAAGKITTQELRGMVHDVPQLGQAIAEGMGVGIGSLRKLNKEGKLTASAVVQALQKMAPSIASDFAKMTPTIMQGFTTIKTGVEAAIHDFNEFTGSSSGIANVMVAIGNHAGILIGALSGIGVVLLSQVIPEIVAFGIALLATPIGQIGAALAVLGAALGYFGGQNYTVAGQTASGWQIIKAAIQTAWDYIKPVLTGIGGALSWVGEKVMSLVGKHTDATGQIGSILKSFANFYIGSWQAVVNVVMAIWNNFPGMMNQVFVKVENLAASAAEFVLNAWQAPLRGIASLASSIAPSVAGTINGALSAISVKLPRAQASKEGAAFGKTVRDGVKSAFNTDYVANFGNAVVGHLKKITSEAKKAKDATDDIHGGTSPESEDEKKKKKKAKPEQISDYAKEVDKLNKAIYDESLTANQLQLADAFDEAGLKRDITLTGAKADAVRKLVEQLQAATAARKVTDELKKLQDANYQLTLTEEQRAISEARIAAGLPADLKVINDKTKAIDAQALANYRLKLSQDAEKENANKLVRLHEDLDKAKIDNNKKRDTLLNPNDSSLTKSLAAIQKQRIEWEAILSKMKNLDPIQKSQLQNEINNTVENEKQNAVLEDRLDKTTKLKDFLVNLWQDPMAAMKQFFTTFLEQLLMSIAKATILKKLLPGGGGGGSLGSMVTGALSSAFGGGKAVGGSVSSSKYYLVGENGPEYFAPGRSGTIIPNQNIGGGASPNITIGGTAIHIHGNANDNDRQQLAAQQAAWQRSTLTLVRKEMERHRR